MRIDGRTLDHKALEVIRVMAVNRVTQNNEKPSAVINSYGLSRTIIYKWLTDFSTGGKEALQSTIGTGRPLLLSENELKKVRTWIVGKDPRQYGFDFGLWTRNIICELVENKFNKSISVTTAGRMLAYLEITPQRPLRRAYQQDPEAVKKWQDEVFPAIRRKASKTGAKIFFLDESGFTSSATYGRTWGEKGKTPVVKMNSQRQSVNAISIMNQQGGFFYDTYTGSFNSEKFIDIIKKFMRGRHHQVFLILDNLGTHKSKAVTNFIERYNGKLHFFFTHICT